MVLYGLAVVVAIVVTLVLVTKRGKNGSFFSGLGDLVSVTAFALLIAVLINLGVAGITRHESLKPQKPVPIVQVYGPIMSVEIEDAYFIRRTDQDGITTLYKDHLRKVIYVDNTEDAKVVMYADTTSSWQWWGYKKKVQTEYDLYIPKKSVVEIKTQED